MIILSSYSNLLSFILLLLSISPVVSLCGNGTKCDQWSPCCSEHGFCGKDYQFCGLACQPQGSYGENSCLKPPQCDSTTYTFNDPSRLVNRESFKGDYRKVDWAVTGKYEVKNGELIIRMPKGSGGGRITSTRYVNYGKITVVMKVSRTAGVVSSFITMSDVKDELDWEWVGGEPQIAQTNYYSKGHIIYTHGTKVPIGSDASVDFHEYTIDWSPGRVVWLIDGKIVRTLTKADVEKAGESEFPDTAARIEIGLWDGGIGAVGTKEWAGGSIDWSKAPEGGFSVIVKSVKVECTGPPTSTDDDYKRIFEGKSNATLPGSGKYLGGDSRGGYDAYSSATVTAGISTPIATTILGLALLILSISTAFL